MSTRWRTVAILAVGWGWFLAYAFPGMVTWDGVLQLGEARSGVYSDDHPTLYIAIWSVLDRIVAGPAAMLVVQSALLLAGLFAMFRRVFAPTGAAIAATAVFVFPPVMMPMTVILKDSLMAGVLLCGIAALLSPSGRMRALGVVAMFVATAVRYNAAAATLAPMLLVDWRPAMRGMRRYALATAVWLAVTAAAFGVTAALTDKHMHSWQTTVAVFDIVGTIAHVDEPMSDDDLQRTLAGTDLRITHDIQAAARAIYTPSDYFRAVAEDDRAFWRVPWYDPPPETQRDAFARAWWELVRAHPLAYAEHRFAVMREVLARNLGGVPWRGALAGAQPERKQLGLATTTPPFQVSLTHAMQHVERHTPLFVPWIYLVIALALAPLALRHRDLAVLLASALLYEATLLLLASSHDYRYSHWMIVATTIVAVALTARRARAKVSA